MWLELKLSAKSPKIHSFSHVDMLIFLVFSAGKYTRALDKTGNMNLREKI